ncbi:MAG: Mur ligase domain-containing protein [Candidatus Staskawiczbacteria bacterium]|jgi:UDP-N-acetylmuramate--alanine ligase
MKIHFIGIGGIGVSALAQYYLSEGAEVSGSDLASSEITDLLKEKGAQVILGEHKAVNISKDLELVIFSPAVEQKNPELKEAKKKKIRCLSYPEALGELTKKYFTITVSGSHGKSTTTSMLSLVLVEAGLDPTVIVGTKLKEFGNSNFRHGKGRYLVIEADEWQASFLNYWPKIAVLTNIEREHLDYYKDLNHILRTFKEYVGHLPNDGVLVVNKEDENIGKVLKSAKSQVVYYSQNQPEAKKVKDVLTIPGKHNVYNGLAVLSVARALSIPDDKTFTSLSKYTGAWRRFEISDKTMNGVKYKLVNDYGHHPTEVRVTLEAIREKFPEQKILCFFQPHQYQRTFNLFDDFVQVFRNASIDRIIITDIYSVAGREKATIKRKVRSQRLVEAIERENVIYLQKEKIVDYLKKNIDSDSVVVLMGAGDIYDVNERL